MKMKKILNICLAAAVVCAAEGVSARTVSLSAPAEAPQPAAREAAAPMPADNTRMAKPGKKTKAQTPAAYAATNRPAEAERLFRSEAVEQEIARIKGVLTNAKLAWMFENCFPNTLDTTVRARKDANGKDDTIVYTGDIHAMWLRDSGAQVWPYLQLANKDEHLRSMLAGVIRRQFKCIELDPYANAFLDPYDPNPDHQWMSDQTEMRPELHERKWEIDSLCYPLRLAYQYWLTTGDASVFDEHWMAAIKNILKTFREQQRKEGLGPYTFMRVTDRQLDTVCNAGKGNPVNPVGLIASVFRPSDDATTFLFLVPSNFFAVTSLRKAAEILTEVNDEPALAAECTALAAEVETALKKYCDLQPSRIRHDLRIRGGRFRQPLPDGRRQRAEPAGDALSGRYGRERSDLPEYAPFRVERGESLLLPRYGGRGHRRSAYRLRHGMADEHHDEGFHVAGRRRDQTLRRDADDHRRRNGLHARVVQRERSRGLHPLVVRMAEHAVRRTDSQAGERGQDRSAEFDRG